MALVINRDPQSSEGDKLVFISIITVFFPLSISPSLPSKGQQKPFSLACLLRQHRWQKYDGFCLFEDLCNWDLFDLLLSFFVF